MGEKQTWKESNRHLRNDGKNAFARAISFSRFHDVIHTKESARSALKIHVPKISSTDSL